MLIKNECKNRVFYERGVQILFLYTSREHLKEIYLFKETAKNVLFFTKNTP